MRVGGAKNSSLPCLAASLLTREPSTLRRVPQVRDVATMLRLLATLGVASETGGTVAAGGDTSVQLRPQEDCSPDTQPSHAGYHLVRQMRASVCVLGPLVARRKHARVALPGGCQIGHRPIDLHLQGLAALGADIRFEQGDVIVESERLRGADIDLRGSSGVTVTGTINVVAAATLARGKTVIHNAAAEPEVDDVLVLLRSMGARISASEVGTDGRTIEVDGVEELTGFDHAVIGDRIEAATWAAAVAAVGGEIEVNGFDPAHASTLAEWMRGIGVSIADHGHGWRVRRKDDLVARSLVAAPYPAIPTDCQAQLAAALTQADGESVVRDSVFPERFGYLAELARLGADVTRTPEGAVIRGPSGLIGAEVMASDLRASAALIIAGLAAEGTTSVRRIYHLDRGYERLAEKLSALGADVRREPDEYPY